MPSLWKSSPTAPLYFYILTRRHFDFCILWEFAADRTYPEILLKHSTGSAKRTIYRLVRTIRIKLPAEINLTYLSKRNGCLCTFHAMSYLFLFACEQKIRVSLSWLFPTAGVVKKMSEDIMRSTLEIFSLLLCSLRTQIDRSSSAEITSSTEYFTDCSEITRTRSRVI